MLYEVITPPSRAGERRRGPSSRHVPWISGEGFVLCSPYAVAPRPRRNEATPVFPYHDENETQRIPVVTIALIGLNAGAWLLVQGAGAALPLARSVRNNFV